MLKTLLLGIVRAELQGGTAWYSIQRGVCSYTLPDIAHEIEHTRRDFLERIQLDARDVTGRYLLDDEEIVRDLRELDTDEIQQLHVCKTKMRHGMCVLLRPGRHGWFDNECDHLDEELVMERLFSVDARPESLFKTAPVRDTTDDDIHCPNVAQLCKTCTLLVFFLICLRLPSPGWTDSARTCEDSLRPES